jgi:DNA polymerase-3 subunit epsilon
MYDLETDGLDTGTSRIVEIAIFEQGECLLHTLVNPGRPIPAEATAVHGITDDMVATAPAFKAIAPEVQRLLDGAVLVTYAGRAFDTVIVNQELRRAGQPGIPLWTVQEIDLYRVWQEAEPRTLVGAYARFCSLALDGAHGARADTQILSEILAAMAQMFGLDVEAMIALSKPADEVDRSGKFKRGEDGVVRFAFGKYDGEPALDHGDYLDWMLTKDFPGDTRSVIRALLRRATKIGVQDAAEYQ